MVDLMWAYHHLDQIESLERMQLIEAFHAKHPADIHKRLRTAAAFHQEEPVPLDAAHENAKLDTLALMFGLADKRRHGNSG